MVFVILEIFSGGYVEFSQGVVQLIGGNHGLGLVLFSYGVGFYLNFFIKFKIFTSVQFKLALFNLG